MHEYSLCRPNNTSTVCRNPPLPAISLHMHPCGDDLTDPIKVLVSRGNALPPRMRTHIGRLYKSSHSAVKRATNAQATAVQNVRVDHRSAHVLVAQQFLDSSDVVARLEQE